MGRILIVDDEESTRLLYAEELSEEGYEVITTNDYLGLLEIIKHQRPDLIVLDIRLGEFNGLDLLQDPRPLVPVALVRGDTELDVVVHRSKDLGLDAVLLQDPEDPVHQRLGVRGLRRLLQRAVDAQRLQAGAGIGAE